MTSAYWNQWDKSDLDSWQGKEDCEDDLEDLDEDCETEEDEDSCSCGYFCMDCLGMSWRDFM